MLSLKEIVKSFQGAYEPVLKGVDLELKEGDFCVVLGSNGSGKSTLLKMISGDYQPDQGDIFVDGKVVTKRDRSSFVATVVQDVYKGTVSDLTLLENIVLSQLRSKKARLHSYHGFESGAKTMLSSLGIGLEGRCYDLMGSLSGGQRQMIATLMAIQSKPRILLLDEHTSALDPKMQELIMNYTAKEVMAQKITSLMVTHRLDDALRYGNRLIMLHKGKIVVDLDATQKQKITLAELLNLFHQYEDLMLQGEKGDVQCL